MRFKISLVLIIASLFCFLGADLALGFGVSPPRVFNSHLIPGAHFEQTIILTQAKPETPLKIKVEINAPDIKDWLTIEPGKEFTIPKGRQQFPMKIIVDVPEDAAYEDYGGEIMVTAYTGGGGQIAVLTGGIVKLELKVSGEEYSDFKLTGVKVPDIEEGDKVKVKIELKNLGNVKIRPSKVYLKIYDQYHKKLLEKGEATDMDFVEPFETAEVIAKMSNELGIGEYWVELEIYKKGELLLKDKRYFHVVEKGELGKIFGLAKWIWLLIIGVMVAIVLSFKFGVWRKLLAKFGIAIKVEKV